YHLINGNASNLDESLEQIRFDFYAKDLQGQKEQRPMNKRGLTLVNTVLGEAFGKLYVDKYFTPEAKQQMETYIDYLLKSFKSHIANID
ncbi:M13 family peptidase, partial [Chryseobacterium sp. SIMBA_038]